MARQKIYGTSTNLIKIHLKTPIRYFLFMVLTQLMEVSGNACIPQFVHSPKLKHKEKGVRKSNFQFYLRADLMLGIGYAELHFLNNNLIQQSFSRIFEHNQNSFKIPHSAIQLTSYF